MCVAGDDGRGERVERVPAQREAVRVRQRQARVAGEGTRGTATQRHAERRHLDRLPVATR